MQKSYGQKTTPEEWFFEAPVTDFKQLISPFNFNNPRKEKINASLKSISVYFGKFISTFE